MIWIIEMQSGGVFEAETKRKAINQIVQFYGENDRQAGQIKAIYYTTKHDKTDELCCYAVSRIQSIIDEGVEEYRKNSQEACEAQKDIKSDYLRAVL